MPEEHARRAELSALLPPSVSASKDAVGDQETELADPFEEEEEKRSIVERFAGLVLGPPVERDAVGAHAQAIWARYPNDRDKPVSLMNAGITRQHNKASGVLTFNGIVL